MKQTTHTILMIEPTCFGFNEEAFLTNSFQKRPTSNEHDAIQIAALKEFNAFVDKLNLLGVDTLIYKDFEQSITPDSIFPNNWISTHQSGELITYPMAVANRQNEVRADIIADLINQSNYQHNDLTHYINETVPAFLEGTGSMIFDHNNKVVYGALSPRTDLVLLERVGELLGYSVISFNAYGKTGELIYHTNVMLCVGDSFACVGTDTIAPEEKEMVLNSLQNSGKEIIELSNDQVYNHFAGNMLQIENRHGETILVMSKNAFDSLTEEQKAVMNEHNDHILAVAIPTIERIGGGSARCMLAEIFLPNFDNLNA